MNRTKASPAQLAYLSEHMKENIDMATGHLSHSLQGKADLENQWEELAKKLNSLGGPIKTASKWKQAWRDLKNNVKKKASHNKNEFRGYGSGSTGNGPPTIKPMSAVEEQVFSVMGPVAVFGMEGVSVTEVSESPEPPLQQATVTVDPLLPPLVVPPEPRPQPLLSPLVVPPEPRTSKTKKRRRIAVKEDNFDTKLLQIEEQKLIIKKERNVIEAKKNTIAEEKNALLNRIADLLQEVAETMKSNK